MIKQLDNSVIRYNRVGVIAMALLLGVAASGCAQTQSILFGSDASGASGNKRTVRATLDSALITEAYSTDRCDALSRGGFIWFTDAVGLGDWLRPLGEKQSNEVMDRVPLASQGALLVDFGTVPTPGHRISLVNNRLLVSGEKAVLQVDLVKSADTAGAMSTKKMPQVLTHPCALYVLPRLGFKVLEIQTGLGDVLTSFEN